jgi:phosphoglycolate phosphatase-like HAD superfamily hydrolase
MKCLIVFDMDGVLADVSRSYRAVIHETARRFFRPAPRWGELPSRLFSFSELARLKQSGGLNNDWDLTYRVIDLLMGLLGPVPGGGRGDPWERFQRTIGRLDLGPLLRFLARAREPLSDLARRSGRRRSPTGKSARSPTGKSAKSSFVSGLCRGEVGSGNLIKQIFQEVYLGAERFRATYGIPPRLYGGKGYMERERLLAPPALLRRLASRHLLGIATGRPEAEAQYFLARFGLRPFFRQVLTLEDCQREERRVYRREGRRVRRGKPHPFLLDALADRLAGRLKARVQRKYYVGDMPDDMQAALRSRHGYRPIGLVQAAPDREAARRRLLQAGARWVAEDFRELAMRFFLDKPILCDENRSHSAIRRHSSA